MKRTPEQAARVAAWLNMLDHCEAQLQRMGALPGAREKLSVANARIRVLESEARESTATSDQVAELRERTAVLSHNLETIINANAKRKASAVARGRKSRDVIDGLRRAVTMLHDEGAVHVERSKRLEQVTKHSEERRLELLALAQLLGCDCVPHKMLEAVKALQVAASAEGNECIRVRLPRNGESHISIDGVTWYEQKTGRKV